MQYRMKISRWPGIWETVQECKLCEGRGETMVEHAVVDYMNGGYLTDRLDTCPDCDGEGHVPVDEDAEETKEKK